MFRRICIECACINLHLCITDEYRHYKSKWIQYNMYQLVCIRLYLWYNCIHQVHFVSSISPLFILEFGHLIPYSPSITCHTPFPLNITCLFFFSFFFAMNAKYPKYIYYILERTISSPFQHVCFLTLNLCLEVLKSSTKIAR